MSKGESTHPFADQPESALVVGAAVAWFALELSQWR